METSPPLFLTHSNWRRAITLSVWAGMMLSSAIAHAQVLTAGADLDWPADKSIRSQLPVNSPGASKPTVVDSPASKTQAAQKKERLTCDAKPVQSCTASPQANSFAQRLAAAVKAGKPDATALAQAIYVAELFPGKAGVQGANTAAAAWRTEQARAWGAANSF